MNHFSSTMLFVEGAVFVAPNLSQGWRTSLAGVAVIAGFIAMALGH